MAAGSELGRYAAAVCDADDFSDSERLGWCSGKVECAVGKL